LLAEKLRGRGLQVDRQLPIDVNFDGIRINDAFRADFVVERKLLVELKSTEKFVPVHGKQVLTYVRLTGLPLGLLINFGAEVFREGVKRIINDRPLRAFAPLRETIKLVGD
jgi:GxxExxY protein